MKTTRSLDIGDYIVMRSRMRRGEETRFARIISRDAILDDSGELLAWRISYEPTLIDGRWDRRGGLWGVTTLPVADCGPRRYGLIAWGHIDRLAVDGRIERTHVEHCHLTGRAIGLVRGRWERVIRTSAGTYREMGGPR